MNQLLDVVGDDEEHELTGMLELLGPLVEDFEHSHYSLPDAEPGEVLRFLMDQHELKQADLPGLSVTERFGILGQGHSASPNPPSAR